MAEHADDTSSGSPTGRPSNSTTAGLYVAKGGQPTGPFSPSEIHERLRSSEISPYDLAWRDGMSSWVQLADIVQISANTRTTPPSLPATIREGVGFEDHHQQYSDSSIASSCHAPEARPNQTSEQADDWKSKLDFSLNKEIPTWVIIPIAILVLVVMVSVLCPVKFDFQRGTSGNSGDYFDSLANCRNARDEAERVLKQNLRDPDSYQWVNTDTYRYKDGSGYRLIIHYRAKNGFGGYEASSAPFEFDANGKLR